MRLHHADGSECPWVGDCLCYRDKAPCVCGHPSGSHAYGHHLPEIRGVSRIGLGACGGIIPDDWGVWYGDRYWPYRDCDCPVFTPTTKDGERLLRPFAQVLA